MECTGKQTIDRSVVLMETVTYLPWKPDKIVTCMRNEYLARANNSFKGKAVLLRARAQYRGREKSYASATDFPSDFS